MLYSNTPERTLSLVIGVPPEVGAKAFDDIIAQSVDLDVGSYLLEPGTQGSAQLQVARELAQDDSLPDVVYDGRSAELNSGEIDALVVSGVSAVIVSGGAELSNVRRNLKSAGLAAIQEPKPVGTLKKHVFRAVEYVFATEGGAEDRRRLYIPKELSIAAVADCVGYIVNNTREPLTKVSVYMESGAGAQTLDNMFIARPHTLQLNERILVTPEQPDAAAHEVVEAAHDAQERFLNAA